MLRATIIFICALVLQAGTTKGQYILNDANKQFELFNYSKAIPIYLEAYAKKPSLLAAERLGQSYTYVFNYAEAEKWFATAVGMAGSNPLNVLRYGEALQQNSKYREAKAQYLKYQSLVDKPVVNIDMLKASCDSAMYWMEHPVPFNFNNEARLNSAGSDWGAFEYNGGVVFSSDRDDKMMQGDRSKDKPFLKFDTEELPSDVKYGWTGKNYLKLYYQKDTDSARIFPMDPGTNYHVGPASFTEDGREMFFTLTRIPSRKEMTKEKIETIRIEIYSSRQNPDGAWSEPRPFRYNNITEWSVGDPFITNDGKLLYFVSDMPGGLGGTDIYVCERQDDGNWQPAVNLKSVNTPGNERSPMFDQEDNFYFSSDGRVGMGGLDIFRERRIGTRLLPPENMGYPINSPQDDFFFNMTGESGYLSSNRIGGKGSDDIYSFSKKQFEISVSLEGIAYNAQTRVPLANVTIVLTEANGGPVTITTNAEGRYSANLNKETDYRLTAGKTDFNGANATVSTKNIAKTTVLKQDLFLQPIPPPARPATELTLNKRIVLEGIRYDFDKWNIRPDAALELDKVVKTLKENPTVWIELGSHTDSRGNDDYNLKLSQRRAEAAVAYIISKGIARERITARGYGETQLLNDCGNGVKCNDEQHQENRRTEIRVTRQ